MRDGYDPVAIGDAIYFNDRERQAFVRLDKSASMTASQAAKSRGTLVARIHRTSKLCVSAWCAFWLGLAGPAGRSVPAMSVTPANPTISVGSDAAVHGEWRQHTGRRFSRRRISPVCAFLTGRRGARDGTSSDSSADGSWTDFSVGPVSGITTATRVAAGDEFACALLANGTAKCWGLGESGQRGDGTLRNLRVRARRR